MRILLTPIGSHGDVHPFVGLGVELKRRGHQVVVITNPAFQAMIERAGLNFVGLGTVEEFRQAIDNPMVWHPRQGLTLFLHYVVTLLRPLYQRIVEQHAAGETVVVEPPQALAARVAQEKLGIPAVTVHVAPAGLRSVADPPVFKGFLLPQWAPSFFRRFVYWASDRFLVAPIVQGPLNALRQELGLPSVTGSVIQWWNSPLRVLGLFPDWFAPCAPDWPAQTRLCGFPLFDERGLAPLPDELERFLRAGEPPIVFTPGSAMLHGQRFFAAAVDACRLLKRRGLLLTLHPEHLPGDLPDSVRHFHYVPFSQVLPRSAAVVHHGGIGTVAQGLAAGVPHIVMPMGFDQPDNAARLRRLGVGAALDPEKFTGPALAECLQEILRPEVGKRCKELAAQLAGPSALGQACDWIEQCSVAG